MSAPVRAEFRALGTGCVVATVDEHALEAALAAVVSELDAIDHACSRFRADSDLERVHEQPGKAVAVDERLIDALDVAMRAAQLTDGDLDPTIGSALVTLGYDRDFATIGTANDAGAVNLADAGRVRVRRVRGWHSITVDRARRTVSVPSGVRVDLGATAKAWAADQAVAAAARAVDCGVLVSLGGDIAVAHDAPSEGWVVALADRHDAPLDVGAPTVTIRDGGLATSSTTARRWKLGDTTVHHILDPRTSLPVTEHWRTVSVAAASAVDANIVSTTCIIRGQRALAWLDTIGLPARLVHVDGDVATVNGWPTDALAPTVCA